MPDKLLLEISAIIKKYALINQKTGAYFNIFNITGISSDEVIICKLLYELLNPDGSHYQGDAFLRLFVSEALRLDFSEGEYKSAQVFRERVIDGGRRIDLCIETSNRRIPIEVKIYAGDQDRQCFDYHKWAKNSDVFYLTLDGDVPSESSAGGLVPIMNGEEIIGYEGVTLLSFRDDVIHWLGCCLSLNETIRIASIREILLQFKDTVSKLTGQTEGGKKMETVNTISLTSENMRSAIEIANALPEAKTQIMLNLFRELKRLFEAKNRTTYDYDEDVIKQYYTSRKHGCPCLSVEIKKLPHNLTATLCIEIDWNLYFCFAFTEVDKSGKFCEYKETEWVKKKCPEAYHTFVDAVFDIMGEQGEKTSNTVFWDYLYDDGGRQFDFKSFSPACIDLASNYMEQAQKIYITLDGYIDAIFKKIK